MYREVLELGLDSSPADYDLCVDKIRNPHHHERKSNQALQKIHPASDLSIRNNRYAVSSAFSNIPESHTSSLGKYKVGKRDISQWGVGIKYYLHGLESTNSKAYDRQIVFHSWNKMPDVSTYPIGAPEGWGCPAISNNFFNRVDTLLMAKNNPVLLWIFNE